MTHPEATSAEKYDAAMRALKTSIDNAGRNLRYAKRMAGEAAQHDGEPAPLHEILEALDATQRAEHAVTSALSTTAASRNRTETR